MAVLPIDDFESFQCVLASGPSVSATPSDAIPHAEDSCGMNYDDVHNPYATSWTSEHVLSTAEDSSFRKRACVGYRAETGGYPFAKLSAREAERAAASAPENHHSFSIGFKNDRRCGRYLWMLAVREIAYDISQRDLSSHRTRRRGCEPVRRRRHNHVVRSACQCDASAIS